MAALAGAASDRRQVAEGARRMKRYRLKCQAFEFEVATDDSDVITDAPPLAAKFLNQNITALTRWLEKIGLADCCRIEAQPTLFE